MPPRASALAEVALDLGARVVDGILKSGVIARGDTLARLGRREESEEARRTARYLERRCP